MLCPVCEYYRFNNVMTFKTTGFIVARHVIAFQNQIISVQMLYLSPEINNDNFLDVIFLKP